MKLTTLVLLIFAALNCAAQTGQVKSFSFKKGEVMDVFLLTTAPNSEDKFERYKQTAFPVAFEYSYRPQKGFKITKLTLGTHTPSSLIFGKWESKEKREGFLANIAQKVPDFHQQRRVLFPYFDLTYYEMQHDTDFSIDTKKYNVATSFWQHDAESSLKFFSKWEKQIKKAGGKIIIQLNEGKSPLGYHYNPDQFYIIQWDNETVFEEFAKQNPLASYNDLKNVHQFVIN